MIVITKKQIIKTVSFIFVGIFAILACSLKIANTDENMVEVSTTPASGKVIVIDAGHRYSR